jgi:hypothetical protein
LDESGFQHRDRFLVARSHEDDLRELAVVMRGDRREFVSPGALAG